MEIHSVNGRKNMNNDSKKEPCLKNNVCLDRKKIKEFFQKQSILGLPVRRYLCVVCRARTTL